MSRFTLSCTTCTLRAPGKDELLETLEHAPAAGFEYWGVAGPPFRTPGGPRWIDADRINCMAADAGLLGMTEVYASAIPTESPRAAIAYVEYSLIHSCDLAVRLNCPLVVFSGGQRDEEGTAGLEASVAGLNALLSMIENMEIKVALEPHFHSRYQDAEDFDFIFERIDHPQLGITVDTGHLHAAGVDTQTFIRKYAGKVWNLHLKDHIGAQSVAIGEGEIDLRGIFALLHEVGYEGALALEIEPEDPDNLPRYVAEAYTYVKNLVTDAIGKSVELNE
ncbi:MAG: sugar phosphate isomerase/epimerase [Candidatus Latescibacteria bacterium]|jgi:sugar phosphate isomerase/epimerase|nr:sugar phosphate isomerase/epimerase [Candidatus Latescibacterota bacterium]